MKYQPYYCEENIWHVCDQERKGWAILISNEAGAVYFEGQRLQPEGLVWDYHVVYLSPDRVVTDFDHDGGPQVPIQAWLTRSFSNTPIPFAPSFLVLPADIYVRDFSSDRRHMLKNGAWLAPPPPWPSIGTGHALTALLRVDSAWSTAAEFEKWLNTAPP